MKNLFLLFLFFFSLTGFSQNFGKMELNLEYEVALYSFTKKMKDVSCYSAVGHQIVLTPKTLDSDIRYKMRKDYQKKLSKNDAIKVEESYVYVKKNDWVVIIEHRISSNCKDKKIRQMFKIKFDKDNNEKPTDELIDEKVKSSVYYLWNKDSGYQDYKILERFQPYNNETNETSIIELVSKLLLELLTDDEKSEFFKKYDAACMCVRG